MKNAMASTNFNKFGQTIPFEFKVSARQRARLVVRGPVRFSIL
jgi:hypothetical protein